MSEMMEWSPGASAAYQVTEHGIDKLAALSILTGESKEEWFIKRAPALARILASYVMPVADADTGGGISEDSANFTGDTRQALQLGQAAVRRDILRVYCPPSEAYSLCEYRKGIGAAKEFYRYLKYGLLENARLAFRRATGLAYDVITWDGGKLHQQYRNNQGRVTKSAATTIVADNKALEAYIRQKQKLVGFAKSGFVNAGKQVAGGQGGRAPAWMSQPEAPGHAVISGVGTDHFYIEMVDDVSYTDKILQESYYTAAVEAWDRNLEREAQAIADYKIRQLQLN